MVSRWSIEWLVPANNSFLQRIRDPRDLILSILERRKVLKSREGDEVSRSSMVAWRTNVEVLERWPFVDISLCFSIPSIHFTSLYSPSARKFLMESRSSRRVNVSKRSLFLRGRFRREFRRSVTTRKGLTA